MKWYILCGIKTIKLGFGKCCSKIVFCKPNVGIAQIIGEVFSSPIIYIE